MAICARGMQWLTSCARIVGGWCSTKSSTSTLGRDTVGGRSCACTPFGLVSECCCWQVCLLFTCYTSATCTSCAASTTAACRTSTGSTAGSSSWASTWASTTSTSTTASTFSKDGCCTCHVSKIFFSGMTTTYTVCNISAQCLFSASISFFRNKFYVSIEKKKKRIEKPIDL